MMETISEVPALTWMITSIGLWAVLRWFARPYIVGRFRAGPEPQSLRGFLRLSLVELAQNVAAVLVLSFAAILVMFAAAATHGGTVADLDRAVEQVRHLRRFFSWLGGAWTLTGLGVLLVALAIFVRRRARTKWLGVKMRRTVQMVENRDEWDERPPSVPMMMIYREIENMRNVLEELRERDGDQHPALVSLEKEFIDLHMRYLLCDAERRVDPSMDPDEFLAPPARTVRQKLAAALLSRGTFTLLEGPRRWLFAAALVLVIPSGLYVAGASAVPALGDEEAKLTALRIGLRESEAMAAISRAVPLEPAAAPPWTSDDDDALDRLAEYFERVTIDPLADAATPARPDDRERRLVLVATREAILREYVEGTPLEVHGVVDDIDPPAPDKGGPKPASHPPPEPAGSRPGGSVGGDGVHGDGVHGDVAWGDDGVRGRFRRDLREMAEARPGLWAKLKARAADLGEPLRRQMSPREIRRGLVSRVVEEVLGTEIGGLAGRAAESSDRARRRYGAQKAAFMAAIVNGRDVDEAANSQRDLRWETPDLGGVEAVKDLPALTEFDARSVAGTVHLGADLQEADVSKEVAALLTAQSVERKARDLPTDDLANEVARYEDYYATKLERRTPRETAMQVLGGASDRVGAVTRARDFEKSAGHRATGGVVLGREPANESVALDVVDLRWIESQGLWSLELVTASGPPVVLSDLSGDIVAAALAFAADGRKVAVTIVNADLGRQRVLLHPVLVDTRVGCEFVALDGVVFDGAPSSGDNPLSVGLRRYAATLTIYNIVLSEILQAALESTSGLDAATVNKWRADIDAREIAATDALAKAVPPPWGKERIELAPVVVAAMTACLSQPQREWSCVKGEAQRVAKTLTIDAAYSLAHDSVVSFDAVSGVRESPFRLSLGLDFTRAPGRLTLDALPFQFLVQLSISRFEESDSNEFVETKPLIVVEAQESIDRTIRAWIAERQGAGDPVVGDLATFTLLQRLFGVALAGRLGPTFPVEKLGELARVTRRAAPRAHPTAEWILVDQDLGPFADGLLKSARTLRSQETRLAGKLERCAEFARRQGKVQTLLAASDSAFEAACPRELMTPAKFAEPSFDAAARSAAVGLLGIREARTNHVAIPLAEGRFVRGKQPLPCPP